MEIGAWIQSENGWVHDDMMYVVPQIVFIHGKMYFVRQTSTIAAV
jgi:hypothetical protein